MPISIENMDIWECGDKLYCKRSDGNLLKIQSSVNDQIIEMLHYIQENHSLDNFTSDKIDKQSFGEIVRFLLSNGIIHQERDNKKTNKRIGFFGDEDLFRQLEKDLLSEHFHWEFRYVQKASELQGLHLLLVVAPIFDHYSFLQELSDCAYRNRLPLLYAEFSPNTFCIGPLVLPLLGSPSLNCYMKRKSVNLRNLHLYSEFIQSNDKKKQIKAVIQQFPYYRTGMSLLGLELDRFWLYKSALSHHLVGKSITMDFIRYTSEHSRILKDPLSPLFQHSTYTPFNG